MAEEVEVADVVGRDGHAAERRLTKAEADAEYGLPGTVVVGVSRHVDIPMGYRAGWISDVGWIARSGATEDEAAHVERLNELVGEMGVRKLSWRNAKRVARRYAERRGELFVVEAEEVLGSGDPDAPRDADGQEVR